MTYSGNCYAVSEAAYHILGGKRAGWTPMCMKLSAGGSHWFLKHTSGIIVDLSVKQFEGVPDYSKAKGCGFLTKQPSQRARLLMSAMTWQINI